MRKIAEDAGVPVTGLHYLLVAPKGLSITSTDAAVRERTVDVIRRLIALAHDLGGTMIVHGSPAHRRLEPGHEEAGRRYGIECWAAIAKDAEAAGITYCIEPLHQPDANFVNTVEEAAAIVRQIGSPGGPHHDRLLGGDDLGEATGARTDPAMDAERADRAYAFQRSEPARPGRRHAGLRADRRGAARDRLYGQRQHRAVHLYPGRRDLRRAQHRLYARRD